MATIIRTSRGNLALSPPREVDDMQSDSSTSPHFNTLRSSLDKTKSPEVAVATVPDADVVITASRRSSSNASSGDDADKVLWEEKMSEERRGREEGVFASDDYDDQDDDECPPATEAKDVHGSTNHIETKDDEEESIDLDDKRGMHRPKIVSGPRLVYLHQTIAYQTCHFTEGYHHPPSLT